MTYRRHIVYLLGLLAFFIFAPCAASAYPSMVVSGKETADWRVGEVLIWRFPKADADKAVKISDRFDELFAKGFLLEELHIKHLSGKWTLMRGKDALLAAEKSFTRGSMDEKMMSTVWLSRLYEAIGAMYAEPLTDRYKIKGGHRIDSKVSWYGGRFLGRKCANGEIFTDTHISAAAKSLPFGTLVKVTVPSTGRSVVVRITDRFAEHKGRALDLSTAAADILKIKRMGIAPVRIEVIGRVGKAGGK